MKDGFVILIAEDEALITEDIESAARHMLERNFEQKKAEHPEDFEGVEFVYYTGENLAELTGYSFGNCVRGWYVDTDG